MVWDDLGRDARSDNKRDRDKWIGVYIGVVALILALCTLGGGNAAKESTMKNIEASNTWAFFQAKNMRRQLIRVQIDEFDMLLASQPAMPDAAKAMIQAKIKQYKDLEARLTSEPQTQEGLDELFKKARSLEADRDLAMRRDPYFDYAQVLLQIAIVLASIVLIAGGGWLLLFSILMAIGGALLTFNGYSLMFAVPFLS